MSWHRTLPALLLGAAALGAHPAATPGAQEPGPAGVVVLVGAGGSFGATGRSARLELGQARRAGVEAIFWTASERLLGGARAVTRFSLDGPAEPLDAGESWKAPPALAGGEKRVAVQVPRTLSAWERAFGGEPFATHHAFDRTDSRDGSPSLHLSVGGSNTETFRDLAMQLVAERDAHQRALACDVRARLFVLPLEQSSDGRAFVQFRLSDQPTGPRGRGAQQDVLHYYLSNAGEPVSAASGVVYIPVPYEPGVWNELQLNLSADAVAHAAGGRDNLLQQIRLGVESRFQTPAAARFDLVSLEQGPTGAAALARQAEMLAGLGGAGGLEPALTWQGLLHDGLPGATLYELGRSPAPTEGEALLAGLAPGAGAGEALAALVTAAHGRGSLVARRNPLAPPFEATGLAAERLQGVDLLLFEPASKTFERQLEFWDELAGAGLFPVGLGAGGELGGERNPLISGVRGLVSTVLAASTDEAELLAALARGRVAFGDPAAFRGALDLESERGFSMGQVVLTDRASAEVRVKRLGAPAEGERLAWCTSRGELDPFAASAPRAQVLEALPDFARAVVLGARSLPVACSNALHFVRAFPAGGLPAERAAFDVAGLRSRGGARLTLLGVRATADGRGVVIEGRAEGDGTLVIALAGGGRASVAWDGLRGTLEQDGRRARLVDLAGEGSVTVREEP